MNDWSLSDVDLEKHRTVRKTVSNPRAQWTNRRGHKQLSYKAQSIDASTNYRIYARQNTNDPSDFSCGLALIHQGKKPLTLVRYNGASHAHGDIHYRCHIHYAKECFLRDGRKPESFAEEPDRYSTLDEALMCLVEDCGISGVPRKEWKDLFDDS